MTVSRIWLVAILLSPTLVFAQSADLVGPPRKGPRTTQGGAPPPSSPLKRDPVQRLEAGALLCETEAALQQHQAAVVAMLNGQDAGGAHGCRTVRTMTPVAVISRHGSSNTQVRLVGPSEQLGWTDSAVRDGPAGGK